MTWFVLYRGNDGKQKRYVVGTYPQMPLAEARTAISALGIVTGKDPVAEEKADADVRRKIKPTMTDLWNAYIESRKLTSKAKSTVIEEDRKWDREIKPIFGETAVADIQPRDLAELLDTLAKKSPVSANRLHSFLSIFFKPALRKGWIPVHPLQWVDKPAKEKPRKRFLSDEEIKTLWSLLPSVNDNARDIIKMMLFTAQRKGEIFKMAWGEIENGVWRQSDNKTDSYNLVPLSPPVIEILEKRKGSGTTWVFPSSRGSQHHIKGIKRARIALNEKMAGEPWTEHDLRRTARTLMSRLKIKHHIRERVLNHSQTGIVQVYDQHDYLDEKRDALEKLASEIERIIQ